MVEYALTLDTIFSSLADATRRDILQRVSQCELTVSEVAKPYDMSLAAISKHLKILEQAKLIIKRKQGKQHFVQASPLAFKDALNYLEYYQKLWDERFDALETFLSNEEG